MLIDWFTVGAQTLNFLVLVWLLKRFLYKPILDAIDGREASIAKELADANAKRVDALAEQDEFQKKNASFDQQRSELLEQATNDANTERLRLIDAARATAEALHTKQQLQMESEEHNLHEEIIRRTHEEVFAITRKTLIDLADTKLEERITEMFLHRLRALNDGDRASLVVAMKGTSDPVRVRSAFDLPKVQETALQMELNALLNSTVNVHFETAPKLISGIELSIHGQRISWNMVDYIDQMENSIAASVITQSKLEVTAEVAIPEPSAEHSVALGEAKK